ncbi:MAG: hypothetical protein J1G30_07345 [Spirochaetales bacterium]|nr:hypothetical protein [Spirochaetales bacterium]
MYKTVFGQENSTNILQNEISYNPPSLAHSMIFYGNRYTGRLSAALETARLINCTKEKADDCNCPNCAAIRDITFNGLIILSHRNYYYEIIETLNCYRQKKIPHLRDKLCRAIKLSFAPLQDFLIENTVLSDSDKKQLQTLGSKIADFIDNPEYTSTELEEIEKCAAFFLTFYKNKNIPVNTFRNMLNWSYMTMPEGKKVVIIDDIDQLEQSSENVLLKRLEEPSDNLYFILLAENSNRVLQTIRSRCRAYYFKDLSIETKNNILRNVYVQNDPDIYASLYEYFHQKDPVLPKNLKPKVDKLINLTFQKNISFSELYLFIESEKDKETVLGITKELRSIISNEIASYGNKNIQSSYLCLHSFDIRQLKEIEKDLRLRIDRTHALNLTPKTQLEGILYPIKEMILHANR